MEEAEKRNWNYCCEFNVVLTGVSALVNLEVFAARKDLAARREGAGKRFLARVHANVIHQLVLGLEAAARARTVLPKAGVIGALGSADVLHGQVLNNVC